MAKLVCCYACYFVQFHKRDLVIICLCQTIKTIKYVYKQRSVHQKCGKNDTFIVHFVCIQS